MPKIPELIHELVTHRILTREAIMGNEKRQFSNRRITRNNARVAYDVISKRWREQRRLQDTMDRVGMPVPEDQRVGRKPPFSIFLQVCEGEDPMKVAKESPLNEVIEYCLNSKEEGGLEVSWRGAEPQRGVMTIPMFGDDEDDTDK